VQPEGITHAGGDSGGVGRRPKLADAIRAAGKLGAPVIISKLDRLFRDMYFISGLMAHRVPFTVTELVTLTLSSYTCLPRCSFTGLAFGNGSMRPLPLYPFARIAPTTSRTRGRIAP
jgi:hypothetical protein